MLFAQIPCHKLSLKTPNPHSNENTVKQKILYKSPQNNFVEAILILKEEIPHEAVVVVSKAVTLTPWKSHSPPLSMCLLINEWFFCCLALCSLTSSSNRNFVGFGIFLDLLGFVACRIYLGYRVVGLPLVKSFVNI